MSDTAVVPTLGDIDLSGLDRWTRTGLGLLARLAIGRLTVILPDGQQVEFERVSGAKGPAAENVRAME